MAKSDYEKLACRLLGLVHETDAAARKDVVLRLGNFQIVGSDTVLDEALERHRVFIKRMMEQWKFDYGLERYKALQSNIALRYEDYRKACGRTEVLSNKHDQGRGPRDEYDFRAQRRFVELYNPVRHTEDRAGYRKYLARAIPQFYSECLQADVPFCVLEGNHTEHTYLVATTKSGKTELLKTCTHELMQGDQSSVVFVDPGGDVADEIARWPEFVDNDRLVYLDPTLSQDQTFTINPFDADDLSDDERIVVGQEIVAAMEAIVGGEGALTNNMQAVLAPSIRLLLDRPNTDLRDLERLMMDDEELIEAGTQSKHESVATFFSRDFKQRGGLTQTKHAIANRISKILGWGKLQRLICGPSTINLQQLLEQKKIIVVRLGQGQLGVEEAQAFGKLLVGLVQGIALKRGEQAKHQRAMTHLIVDECQNFITPAITKIIEEGRKFGLAIWLAQLSVGRGMNDDFRKAVLRTTRCKIAGLIDSDGSHSSSRLVGVDAELLEYMKPGEFFYKHLGKPTVRFQASDRLLENRHGMSGEEWSEVRDRQLAKYYRPIAAEAKAPTEAVQSERKRRLQ